MKYLIGFILGGVVTSLFFINYLKGLQLENASSRTETVASNIAEEDNGFVAFYKRFNEDSLFQMEHITFPLEGVPARDSAYVDTGKAFHWQKEKWILHRPFNDMDGAFQRSFLPMGEDLMIENIKHSSGRYGMQRRYALYENGWFLIYYAAMNELAVEEPG